MLTRNWYRFISYFISCKDNTNVPKFKSVKGAETVIATNNALNIYSINEMCKTLRTEYVSGSGAGGVYFGTGDTPPTLDDYKLSGDVISGISASVDIVCTDGNIDSEYAEIKIVYTVTNSNGEEITIKEVALATSSAIMIDRTVLDTPVTIPAGGIGQVTYTIRMNYPTA